LPLELQADFEQAALACSVGFVSSFNMAAVASAIAVWPANRMMPHWQNKNIFCLNILDSIRLNLKLILIRSERVRGPSAPGWGTGSNRIFTLDRIGIQSARTPAGDGSFPPDTEHGLTRIGRDRQPNGSLEQPNLIPRVRLNRTDNGRI